MNVIMRWIQAGWCLLALISLSAALQISQKPRFYGVKTGSKVKILCEAKKQKGKTDVTWYRSEKYDEMNEKKTLLNKDDSLKVQSTIKNGISILTIWNATEKDTGVYFCKMNTTLGPGTEVLVVRHIDLKKAQHLSKLKDGLIILQGLLLPLCIAAVLLRKHKELEKSDSMYEEPEMDHIYEGLAIETCGDLYEDLTLYSQPEIAEAPWE
ncbi:B-cell antigen receptor complex-associated protein beta chain [Oryzias melastigma]|uniref:B-cell antigen receptor complex-associated protein beta chain n=1 Tax=Oryzias melastigma TaxID=30732 RepID=A0A834FD00_ORYME|nr:B-cell antigen receptor complex-associated protein beta chain [Oryzias melastigma]